MGLLEAITVSIASVLAYNFFFLPPIGTLTIADPQNWVALCTFLITAITASQLSVSAHRKADEAEARQREMERLYELSRALMLEDHERELGSQLVQQIVQVFRLPFVAFLIRQRIVCSALVTRT